MALDLGSIITSLGGQYIQSRYQQPMTIQAQPALNFGSAYQALVGPEVSAAGVAPCPSGYRYNAATGQWEKKRRRRRKRLATPSDLKDLAALKGVLGGGEAFKVWIATHS